MFALVCGEHDGDWPATAAQIVALETKIAARTGMSSSVATPT